MAGWVIKRQKRLFCQDVKERIERRQTLLCNINCLYGIFLVEPAPLPVAVFY